MNNSFKSIKNFRSISIAQLKMLPFLHLQPINLLVSKGTY